MQYIAIHYNTLQYIPIHTSTYQYIPTYLHTYIHIHAHLRCGQSRCHWKMPWCQERNYCWFWVLHWSTRGIDTEDRFKALPLFEYAKPRDRYVYLRVPPTMPILASKNPKIQHDSSVESWMWDSWFVVIGVLGRTQDSPKESCANLGFLVCWMNPKVDLYVRVIVHIKSHIEYVCVERLNRR